MKFLCGLQRFIPFICLKPDTKRCKQHSTPSTWPLEDQEFYMSFSLRYFYEILTRSLRDLYEIWILQGKAAGQGSRDLFYSSLLCSRPLQSLLLFNSILFSTLLYIVSSTLLFSSTVLSSVRVKLLRSHPREFLSQEEYVSKTCVPLESVRKINATNN